MSISPQWILALVGAIMPGLALKDLARDRKITPAVKSRLLVALVFAAVLAWLLLQQK